MTASLFFLRPRPGKLPLSPPKDDPAWLFSMCGSVRNSRKPTPTEKLLRAHRIAAEVRDRRGMKVMKTCMASWTADDA